MIEVVTAAPFAAGLTNQKLALIGLALAAKRLGRPICLPDLVEYVAADLVHERRPWAEVIDQEAAVAGFMEFGVTVVEGQAEPLDPTGLLADAGEALAVSRRERDDVTFGRLCGLLAALRPARPIAEAAARASDWLASRGISTGCQMRIERDWLHWVELHRADDRIGDGERLYLSAGEILAKIAATIDSGPIYVTCNEADLPETQEAIRAQARDRHGMEVVFRSQVPLSIGEAGQGPLAGAALDFAIAGGLPCFIGHTRSTFFNALALTAHGEGRASDYWLYNNRGDQLRRRTDHGAFVRPWAAANL